MGRTKPIVPDDYVVGLVDGEGCFHVNMGTFSTYRSGVRVQMHFHVKMQEQDRPLLEKIKNTLNCGKVYFQKEKRKNHCQCYRYTVFSQKDIISIIIPFFKKNPLRSTSKHKSFKAFCEIGRLVEKREHLTDKGIAKIRSLKTKMNQKTVGLA